MKLPCAVALALLDLPEAAEGPMHDLMESHSEAPPGRLRRDRRRRRGVRGDFDPRVVSLKPLDVYVVLQLELKQSFRSPTVADPALRSSSASPASPRGIMRIRIMRFRANALPLSPSQGRLAG